jgi:hypothetical protein
VGVVRLSLIVAALAALAPAAAQAAVYQSGHCKITVPDGWVTSRSRIARPDKKVWASLMDAPTSAEIVAVEAGLQATRVSEDGRIILMVSSASFAGLTNKQYHAITKTAPSCVADVTAPAGPEEALARQIAGTVTMVP